MAPSLTPVSTYSSKLSKWALSEEQCILRGVLRGVAYEGVLRGVAYEGVLRGVAYEGVLGV